MSVVRFLALLATLLGVACEAGGAEGPGVPKPAAQSLSATTSATAPARARARAPRMSPEQLVERLRSRLSRPPGELRVQTGRDGSHRVALDGHLQHATIAVIGPDGRVQTSCVDGPEAAAHALSARPRGAN